MSRRTLMGGATAFMLPAVFLLPWWLANPQFFWNDDYQFQYIGAFAEVARSWLSGSLPLLTQHSWAAGNLAGEYQYGTLSVWANAWHIALHLSGWSLAGRAAVYALVHLGVLSCGAYVLARSRGLGGAYATLVALCASLNGYMVLWGAVDWITAVASFCWLPWLWWCLESVLEDPRADGWRLAGIGICTYLILSAGWPFTVLMAAVVFAVLACGAAVRGRFRRVAFQAVPSALAGVLLALPAVILLAENLLASGRGAVGAQVTDVLSFPVASLAGIVTPGTRAVWITFFGGMEHPFFEWSGAVVPLVALVAARFRCRKTDLVIAGIALACALLPGIGVFRWSFRWIPLFHLAFALAGAGALSSPGDVSPANARARLMRALVWVGSAGLFAGLVGSWPIRVSAPAAFGLLTLAGWGVAARLGAWSWRGHVAASVAALGLATTYYQFTVNPLTPRWAFSEAIRRPAPLEADRLYLSLHEPPERMAGRPGETAVLLRPGNTGFLSGLRMVNGYSPVAPRGVFDLLGLGTHGDASRRVVRDVLAGSGYAHRLLAIAGVDGLLLSPFYASFPEDLGAEWREYLRQEEGLVLHREPRVGRTPAVLIVTNGHRGAASLVSGRGLRVIREERHVAEVEVPAMDAPCHLLFRRPWYSGYRASVDGESVPVECLLRLSPGVHLPPGGMRRVRLEYRPAGIRWLPACWGAALVAAGLALAGWRRENGSRSEP